MSSSESILPALREPRAGTAVAFLFVLALLVRVPFFFPDVIDWDESTYVLIGQSVLDGHLPYVRTWDGKPPLGFVWFALAIATFGRSVPAIRLAGTVMLVAAAVIVYLTARRWWGFWSALLAASLLILSVSLNYSGQPILTEHVMLLPFAGALYVLTDRDSRLRSYLWGGVLLGAAALIRLNILSVLPAVALWISVTSRGAAMSRLHALGAFIGGVLFALAFVSAPYLLTGEWHTFWRSAVVAPFLYSESQQTVLENLVSQSRHTVLLRTERSGLLASTSWTSAILWIGGVIGCVWLCSRYGRARAEERRMTLLLVLIAVSTIASILMSGANHPHYLIQAMPVFALLAVAWIAYLPQRAVVSVWCFTILSLVPSGIPTLQEYQGLISRWQARQDLRYGSAYKIAAHLRRENPSGRPVYLLTDHVVYWLNGMTPPTRLATHPSAFAKPFVASALGTTGTDELTAVFRQSPEFVVLPECADWIDLDLSRKLDAYLQAGYMLEARIDGRYLYRRSSGGQPTGAAVNPTLPWRQC